ncbi:MAG TPA: DUF2066 domain-containing protein [Gammaproteobacteria bacterium]|nr:DUF2066 domain-containing protein [Gammaproteobacteria bacterium]
MRAWSVGLLGMVLLLLAAGAQGAIVNGLYEASVPVPDQTPAARNIALQQALAAVLVKVTGERTAGRAPALAALTSNPNQFLQQYHYEQTQDANGNAPASGVTYFDLTRNGALAIAGTGLVLHAKFDPDAVNQAVSNANEPVWGRERPATLVWLALQDGNTRTILSATSNPAVAQAMNAAATQRGVPLIFPAMDAQDRQAIAFTDIWTNNATVIQQASARYQPDAILVGNIYLVSAGQYAVRWQLTSGGSVQAWSGAAGDLVSITTEGLQTAADGYARQYAISAGAQGVDGVTVQVDGVNSVDAYAQVLAYLDALTPVKSVQVSQVKDGSVYFRIDTHGSVTNLAQAITLGDLLKPVQQFTQPTAPAVPVAGSISAPAVAATPTLHFQYGQ